MEESSTILTLIDKFAEAGLVFLVMAIVIYMLYQEYKTVTRKLSAVESEYKGFLIMSQEKHLETMIKFSQALDRVAENIAEIKGKI